MVIVIPNNSGQVDFIILTSINYALARVGGPVTEFSPMMDLKGEKQVCISGHGGIGSIEHLPASTFANVLADPVRGCAQSLQRLIFTCCYAGKRDGGKVGTSVIDIFASTLKIKDLKISGAMGPSIKANVLGDAFKVINTDAKSRSGKSGGDIQKSELKETGKAKLADLTSGSQRKMEWDKIKKKIDSGITKENKPYIEYKSEKYAKMSGDFYQSFVGKLGDEGLLLDAGHSMHTVYWDGSKVVDVSASSKWSCYITSAAVDCLNLPDDCNELTTLRWFRDSVMTQSACGRRDINTYYRTAPRIVSLINSQTDSGRIYQNIFDQYIVPSVVAIKTSQYDEAHQLYKKMVSRMWNKFIR